MKALNCILFLFFALSAIPGSGQQENVPDQQRARTVYWSESFTIGTTTGTTDGGVYVTGNGTWTVAGPNGDIWKHSFSGAQGEPAFAGDLSGDGWMLFDVDSVGGGMPDGELISPRIDLTGAGSFFFRFKQYYKVCCYTDSLLFFGISTDDGITWSEFDAYHYLVQSDLRSQNPEEFRINAATVFDGVSDLTQVRLRFRWRNNGKSLVGKFWIIDEISIEDAPDYDLKIEEVRFYSPLAHWQGGKREYFGNGTSVGLNTGSPVLVVRYRNNGKLNSLNTHILAEVTNTLNGSLVSAITNSGGGIQLIPGMVQTDTILGVQFGAYTIDVQVVQDNTDEYLLDNNHPSFVIQNSIETVPYKKSFSPRGIDGGVDGNGMPNAYMLATEIASEQIISSGFRRITVAFNAVNNATLAGAIIYPIIFELNDTISDLNQAVSFFMNGSGTIYEEEISPSFLPTTHIVYFSFRCFIPVTKNPGKHYFYGVDIYGAPDRVSIQNGESDHPGQKTTIMYTNSSGWKWIQQTPKISLVYDFQCGFSIEEDEASSGIVLQQNHPNPFSEETFIEFELIRPNHVELEVRDVLGKLVYSMSLGILAPGEHMVSMSASVLSSGLYYYSLVTPEGRITRKMVIE